MADGAEQRRGVEKAGLVPVEPSGWTRRSVVDEEENGAVTEQWVVQGAGQASQLARSEPADDVVAPALDPGAVQADHRMPLSDQLHERIAAGVGQLGKVAGQEILEDQLEGPPPNVGVAIVVARDDHQEPGGDERLKEGTRVAQLRLVTQGGEVAGQQDAIGSQARHLIDQACDALLHSREAPKTAKRVKLEATGSTPPAGAPEGTPPPVDLVVEVAQVREAEHGCPATM